MAVSHPIVVVIATLYNCDIEWSGWLEVYLETAAPQDVRLVHHGRREEADLQPVSQPMLHAVLPSTVWLVEGWMQTPPRCCRFCNTAATTTTSSSAATSSSSLPPPSPPPFPRGELHDQPGKVHSSTRPIT